tara:strand:- start:541 stop:1314 length:774 start_codon:yes stop_codon:yes gene_type:complete
MNTKTYKKILDDSIKRNNKIKNKSIKKINDKAIATINTPLYATIAFQETKSLDVANKIHDLILLETQHILFLDNYYETGSLKEKKKAEKSNKLLLSKLDKNQKKKLKSLENKLFTYWKLEKKLSKKIKSSKKITEMEIKTITRKKSKDIFLYSLLLSFFVKVPKSITNFIYAQQLERDLEDDFEDLREDFQNKIASPLILRLYKKNLINMKNNYSQKELERLTPRSNSYKKQKILVREIIKKLDNNLPKGYSWIKKI